MSNLYTINIENEKAATTDSSIQVKQTTGYSGPANADLKTSLLIYIKAIERIQENLLNCRNILQDILDDAGKAVEQRVIFVEDINKVIAITDKFCFWFNSMGDTEDKFVTMLANGFNSLNEQVHDLLITEDHKHYNHANQILDSLLQHLKAAQAHL
ncbi:MAG: hypothetical protein JSS50_03340 [Proteobacteria bacterium]|nr:hypothetical protein [Pseudomonadota bacterium]